MLASITNRFWMLISHCLRK